MTWEEDHHRIAALKRREPAAWGSLYDRHCRETYGVIFHLVHGDRALAEDLHQELWLAVLDGIDGYDPGRGSLRSWIFGVARRRVALHWRRRGLLPTAGPDEEDLGEPLPGESLLPEEVMEQMERAAAVRAALLAMPEDRRNVLVGKYVEGLPVDQIADRMGKTPKAVESLLTRARDQLRRLLGPYLKTPTGVDRDEPSNA